jgi:hypothetical protein
LNVLSQLNDVLAGRSEVLREVGAGGMAAVVPALTGSWVERWPRMCRGHHVMSTYLAALNEVRLD